MLSEDSVEKLIQPILNRQQDINTYVLKIIAERVNSIGKLLPTDIYKLERLYKSGSDTRKINQELARLANLQVADIKQLIRTVAEDSYMDSKPYYDYRNKSFIPFEKNTALQKVVNSIAKQTQESYVNLSKSQGFMLREPGTNKFKPTTISETYQKIVDQAIQKVVLGVSDYRSSMRLALKELINSGIRYVTYDTPSGKVYSQRLDSAVRRNLLDGVRAINQGIQDEVGKQFGADGKELTVHMNPAPDHAPVQGHQFKNEEFDKMQEGLNFKDVDNISFTGFPRPIGALNCRHFAISIVIGAHKPNYTKKQLQNILERNEQGYTMPDGTHLTMYQCTQRQRKYELEIRKCKDGQITARSAGDTDLAKQYQARINNYMDKYTQFSKSCGLPLHKEKMVVSGYHPISVK